MAGTHCGEAHGEVVTRLAQVEREQTATATKLDAHCANGGTGHVGRREFDDLRADVKALKTLGLRLIIGVLIASGGGSALAPMLLKLIQ